jgi:hypothetical protein
MAALDSSRWNLGGKVLGPLKPIQVVGEYPKYSFKKEEIVVVVANNKDLFWIAGVTYMDNKKIISVTIIIQ